MFKFSTIHRMSLALSLIGVSLLLLTHWIGLLPDTRETKLAEARSRRAICESVAVQFCLAAERNDLAAMRAVAELIVARNDSVARLEVRRSTGQTLVSAVRKENAEGPSATECGEETLTVPIFTNQHPWGDVHVTWLVPRETFVAAPTGRLVLLVAFVGLISFVVFCAYLRRVLTHLDPSTVVPERVKNTLDTLAEGVVVLDNKSRVVLANQAFAAAVGKPMQSLCGERVSDFAWTRTKDTVDQALPWERAAQECTAQRGEILRIDVAGRGEPRTFSVNAAPILGSNQGCRGVLATFDDLTQLEQKTATLVDLVQCLQESQKQIEARNEELQFLATRDPLTSCFNRRAFFSQAESTWDSAYQEQRPLAVIMADVDHFKGFNDKHGHAVGDKVLQHVSKILRTEVRKQDMVCRFGGEEFCILLAKADLEAAGRLADRMRSEIETSPCEGLRVTVSMGIAVLEGDTPQLQIAIERADRALYASKRSGRNRVSTWRELVERGETELKPRSNQGNEAHGSQSPVSLKAINTLYNSLWHRDRATAEHSRRVANLCMVFGQGFLQERDMYILEAAALLHDVGKLGVPDAILLKPGPLTSDEWKLMAHHDDISRDLVEIVFATPEMSAIVATHHAWYGGNPREPDFPTGEKIPLGARILAIADAYDAIVSDRAYSKARSHAEAVAELRRCSGTQFDPSLVERFIETLEKHLATPVHAAIVDEQGETVSVVNMPHSRMKEMSEEQLALSALSLAADLVELCQPAEPAPAAHRKGEATMHP